MNTSMQVRRQNRKGQSGQDSITTFLTMLLTGIYIFRPEATAAQATTLPGSITGKVLVIDSTGSSYVPGPLVVLNGPESLKTESNANGEFRFPSVAPGAYISEASAPRPGGQLSFIRDPGHVTEVTLNLGLTQTASSVTVTPSSANADIDTTGQTLEGKTITTLPMQTSALKDCSRLFRVSSEARTGGSI